MTKFFCRCMDVLLNILYFSVFLKHFILSQRKSKTKTKDEVFLFLPFVGNNYAIEWWNVDCFPWWDFSSDVAFSVLFWNPKVVRAVEWHSLQKPAISFPSQVFGPRNDTPPGRCPEG